MIQIDQIRVPPGGWHFFEAGIRYDAPTYQELYQKLLKIRLNNRQPFDRLQEEINNYIASISPTHTIRTIPQVIRKEKSLSDRIYNWACNLYDMFRPHKQQTPLHEANIRGEVCASCPHNLRYKSSCGSCANQTDRLLTAVKNGRHSTYEHRLGGCNVLGIDLSTAVLLEDDMLGDKSNDSRLPDNCWRKAQ
jgi:hypothetical protein